MATRIEQLAQAKPNLLKFPDRWDSKRHYKTMVDTGRCHKRSVYWLDKLPVKSNHSTTAFVLTPRLAQLSQCKNLSPYFEDNRRAPEWKVAKAALRTRPSDRICSLAQPRLPAEGWEPDRPLLPTISIAVRTAKASPRICQLAQPKNMTQSCSSTKTSMSTTPRAKPSPRIHQLATPKKSHPEYLPDRPVSGPVSTSAREAVASERLQTLARPKPRKPLFEGFDPYRVNPAARTATASPRLQELSLPLERRCRTK